MSKRCARCEKTVYPLEELKCLDKIWHKGCFKCQECNMTLSMKTYKGFNKLPYCEAHIPKAKATAVFETPEMRRLAENTKNQSTVQYHADFEKSKTRFTQVADDPETLRLKTNTKNISNIEYHGEYKRKEEMERKRNAEEEAAVERQREQQQMDQLDQLQSLHISNSKKQQQFMQQPTGGSVRPTSHPTNYQQTASYTPQPAPQQQNNSNYQKQQNNNNSAPYTPQAVQNVHRDSNQNAANSPYSSGRVTNSQTLVYSSQQGTVNEPETRKVGSIADYDPMNDQYGSLNQQQQRGYYQQQVAPPANQMYSNNPQYHHQNQPQFRPPPQAHPQQQQPSQPQGYQQGYTQQQQHGYQPYAQQPQPQQHQYQQRQPQKVTAQPTNLGRCYQAMYDYEAADADEISFLDGDLIINCSVEDEGWMTGTVQRTNAVGMLPANYVRRVS